MRLIGNVFVDNGLMIIAAKAKCEKFEDLTLDKMKEVHGNGETLARNNDRLKSTNITFLDSMLTQPSFKKDPNRLSNYAKMVTAIMDNIGYEEKNAMCDLCGNPRSLDLNKLFNRTIVVKEKKNQEIKYIDRGWFPLIGSIGSDAQALPGASRALNVCSRCVFAVQYLPQGVFSMRGMLVIMQTTSIDFWFKMVKQYVEDIDKNLHREDDKVETIGTKKSSDHGGVITRMVKIMEAIEELDKYSTLKLHLYSNMKKGDRDKENIPNFVLSFLDKAAKNGLRDKVREVIGDVSYFLQCVENRQDYSNLYPSKKYHQVGASPKLFLLYKTVIQNYTINSLHTAHKIAQYIGIKIDELGIDIDKSPDKQSRVKKQMTKMVEEEKLSFDEYYELFVRLKPWPLLKYYLLTPDKEFKLLRGMNEEEIIEEDEYKNKIIEIGTAIYKSYIKRRTRERFEREVLGGFARNQIHERWLRVQLERLREEGVEFSFDTDELEWDAMLFRLLLTNLNMNHDDVEKGGKEVDIIQEGVYK